MKDTTLIINSRRPRSAAERDLYLVCMFSGMSIVEARPLLIREEVTLGRTMLQSLDLSQPDSTMSRHHFRIGRRPEGVFIEDLGSSNGTFVNRQEISGTLQVVPGDVIRTGETLFLVLERPPAPLVPAEESGAFVTRHPPLRRLLAQIDRVAPSNISLLLLGETGTGKDVLAQYLHRKSGRPGRFVPVNCSAIPATLLEASLFGHEKGAFTGADRASAGMFRTGDRGTLFLDEIGEMELELQAKLLRSLETRSVIPLGAVREIPVDVRIVAATSRSREELECGQIREDLLGRLEDLVVQIPPLRERREDILLFVAREMGLDAGGSFGTADVAEALLCYPWPRNVRELIRTVRAALLLHNGVPPLRWEDLKDGIRSAGGLPTPMPGRFHTPDHHRAVMPALSTPTPVPPVVPSRNEMEALVADCDGNVSAMARRLEKDRKQIYRWLERYGLKD